MGAHLEMSYGPGYSPTVPTEKWLVGRDISTPLDGSQAGCIYGAGASSTPLTMMQGDIERDISDAIMQRGIPCMCSDNGGTLTWGNPTAVDRYGEAWVSFYGKGVSSSKVVLVGTSMGGLESLNGAWNRGSQTHGVNISSLVKAIVLILPVLDLQDIIDNNRSGFASSIIAAHGGTPTYSTYSPYVWAASLIGAAGIPTLIYYASDDPICLAASTATFGAAINSAGGNCTLVNLGAVGHNSSTVPPSDIANFLRRYV